MEDHYISVTMSGSLHVEGVLDDQRIAADFTPGRCLIMSAGQENVWRWDRPTDEIHVYLKPHLLRQAAEHANVSSVELINRFAFEDPILHHIIQAAVDELREPGIAGSMFAQTTAQYLALHLIRRHCATTPQAHKGTRLTPAQLRRVEAKVEAELKTDLSLDDLADAARVSRFHFAHAFKQTTGIPPHRWLINQRVMRAKQLLADSNLSILHITSEVGFQSQSHFGQVFKSHTGLSPVKWRRSVSS
jgi:AraC family transcriptional regulator